MDLVNPRVKIIAVNKQGFLLANCALVDRSKRQTYKYDDEFLAYAHPHPHTKVQQGYLARYAPHDWPKW
ncbi:hypothetical protein NECAME_06863 [Necator americanus]|uniref:Uncharacterized protein n=1 Tax=Necator americanus TaxID=51031 RepID=W2TQY0_NECAM|nr:hypothetical protein NECAME_06863 [Necator americanus]ETN84460.1 hypothetical protein NECAME_06863 [Necator americanus]